MLTDGVPSVGPDDGAPPERITGTGDEDKQRRYLKAMADRIAKFKLQYPDLSFHLAALSCYGTAEQRRLDTV